ncbi:hypothetical protein ACLOJK_039989 [Asimina triloba]
MSTSCEHSAIIRQQAFCYQPRSNGQRQFGAADVNALMNGSDDRKTARGLDRRHELHVDIADRLVDDLRE